MPRREARIRVLIWDDPDYVALPMDAQWLYLALLSQPGVSHAGVLTIPRREWSDLCADDDAAERISVAREVLEDRRYIVVDDVKDEVLIRSVIRWDIVSGPPGSFRSAMEAAMAARSPKVKAALYAELLRLDESVVEAKSAANGEAPIAVYRRALAFLSPSPRGPNGARPATAGAPSDDGSQHAMFDESACYAHSTGHATDSGAMRHGMRGRPVVVEVESGSSVGSVDQLGGRAHAHTREAGPGTRPADTTGAGPPPNPQTEEQPPRPDERCRKHRDVEDPPSCRGCRKARQDAEAWDREHQRRTVIASIPARRCPMCDAEGWLHEVGRATPVSPPWRCDHASDHHEQVQRAREAS